MKTSASFVGLGVVPGAVIGALTDNVGICVAFGIIIGAVLSAAKTRRNVPPQNSDKDNL